METFTFLIVFFFSGHIVTSVFDYIKNRRIERIKKEEDKTHLIVTGKHFSAIES